MVSAQLTGTYRLYIENTQGVRRLVAANGSYWWSPGGSSEGAVANTPEKWNYLPLSRDVGKGGYKIVITYQGAAGTTDASDGFWSVPIVCNGNAESFGNIAHANGLMTNNFTAEVTPGDIAIVANLETPIQSIRAKEGIVFQVGGGRVNLSIENNA